MKPTIFDADFDVNSSDAQEANRLALKQYQDIMIEHIVLQRAFYSHSISASPSINERFLDHKRDCQHRKTDYASPEEMGAFAMRLMEKPSTHFPAIALAVREDIEAVDVSDLVAIIHPDKNPALKDLRQDDKDRLSALSQNFQVQKTMQVERLHEDTFGGGHLPNSCKDRYNAWVNHNVKGQVSAFGKGLGFLPLITQPAKLAVEYATKQALSVTPKGVASLIDQAFRHAVKLCGKSPAEGTKTKEHWNKKLEDFFYQGGGSKIPEPLMSAGGLLASGLVLFSAFLYNDSPTIIESMQVASEAYAYSVDKAGELREKYLPEANSPGLLVGVAAGLSMFAKSFKASFNFSGPSPLKKDPLEAQSARLTLRESDTLNLDDGKGRVDPTIGDAMECESLGEPVIGNARDEWRPTDTPSHTKQADAKPTKETTRDEAAFDGGYPANTSGNHGPS